LLAEKLEKRVPRVLSLRNGLLFMEWITGPSLVRGAVRRGDTLANSLADYVAERTIAFPLPNDLLPVLRDRGKGWDYLADSLAQAHGRVVGKLLGPAVKQRFVRQFENAPLAFIDGNMSRDEWIVNNDRMVKLGFEGHAFDNSDMFITDPAFDLAGAVFEFSLSLDEEEILLKRYAGLTGDIAVTERMPALKKLYGLRQLYQAGERLRSLPPWFDPLAGHARFEQARRFLMDSLLRHYGQFLPTPRASANTKTLFVLDIDGVLDEFIYEYPTTTLSGLEALGLLHRHDIPAALNTGRSLDEVKAYAKFFHLWGGVAEHGAVLWDARKGREKILIDAETRDQLERARRMLSSERQVYFSPGYCASLHCYRYEGGVLRHGMKPDYVQRLFAREGLNKLRAICTNRETVIVPGLLGAAVHAIGDSSEDFPMLRDAQYGYAVANSTSSLKASARETKVRILRQRSQLGLLEAARLAVSQTTGRAPENCTLIPKSVVKQDPLLHAAWIADLSKLRRSLALFQPGILKRFEV
jgi:hypothetical protein